MTRSFSETPAAVYQVKRVLSYPLDAGKRLYYYERKDRHATGRPESSAA